MMVDNFRRSIGVYRGVGAAIWIEMRLFGWVMDWIWDLDWSCSKAATLCLWAEPQKLPFLLELQITITFLLAGHFPKFTMVPNFIPFLGKNKHKKNYNELQKNYNNTTILLDLAVCSCSSSSSYPHPLNESLPTSKRSFQHRKVHYFVRGVEFTPKAFCPEVVVFKRLEAWRW